MNDHLYGPLNNAGTLWKKQLDAHLIGVRNDARMLEEILASSILEHEESGKEQTFRLHVFPDGSQPEQLVRRELSCPPFGRCRIG